jgi:hypothetical protein
MDKVSQILAETARDLTIAHVARKPLDRVIAEGAARIHTHYAKPRYCKCGAELLNPVFEECRSCTRDAKGDFEFERDES